VDLRSQLTHATQQHQRHSLRLKDYDYSQEGAYFVTICTHKKALFFENEHISAIVEKCWLAIPVHFPNVQLDEWVIMPNHLHAIVLIEQCRGVQLNAPTIRKTTNPFSAISPHRNTLAIIVRTYKAAVTTRCRRAGSHYFAWQRNYYEHVIRNEDDLNEIRQYILDNPVQWDKDENNPTRQLPEPPYDNMVGARHAVPTAVRRQGCQLK
jgi:putative transposase